MHDTNPADADAGRGDVAAHLDGLPRRVYPFRVLGIGLASLPMFAVLRELDAGWPSWAWTFAACFLWPQLAYLLARRSADPFRAELRNLMIDSALAGSLVPLMHFNLLPSVVLPTVVTADKINSGIRGLWLRSLPGMALAALAFGILTGFEIHAQTSMAVVLACLPIMVIHTLAVALSSYRLVRRVQRQNRQLEALNRRDALTGLESRGFWERQAQALLRLHQADGGAATLVLIDADEFKRVNDRYGHGVGDDVLCAIADLLRRHLPADAHAGRLGGDEFIVAMPASTAEAAVIAEALRAGVAALEFPRTPGLQASVSIGIAAAPAAGLDLREWIEAADRALYRAKHAGRNRIVGSEAVGLVPE